MKFVHALSLGLALGASSNLAANSPPKAPQFFPEIVDDFQGWTHVTTAMNPTGEGLRIDIGGGNNDHADLSTFDPAVLTPGSVVNIYHRSTPYNTIHLFHKDGTEDNPITIHGVTDAEGNRPIFDCTNSRVGVPAAFGRSTLETLGFFVLSRTRDGGTYADATEWNTFQNLHIRNCAASIRAQRAGHLTIQHNIIDTNNNGLFISDAEEGSYHITVRGNRFVNNGTSGGFHQHSIYFQAYSESPDQPNVIEGNFFDEMLSTTEGMQIKTRATDTVIRYNTVLCQRLCFEIGELQGELPETVYGSFSDQELVDRLHTSHVYGNQFYVNAETFDSATYPFHVGVDTGGGGNPAYVYDSGAAEGNTMVRGTGEGRTYFYHNSVSIVSNDYHQALFGLGWKDTDITGQYGNLTAINNVFRLESSAGGRVSHVRLGGNLTYSGVNQLSLINHSAASPFPRKNSESNQNDPDVVITGASAPTLVVGKDSSADPNFVNGTPSTAAAIDLRLNSGSPAIGAAAALPEVISNMYPVDLQPIPAHEGGGVRARSSSNNLGAFE